MALHLLPATLGTHDIGSITISAALQTLYGRLPTASTKTLCVSRFSLVMEFQDFAKDTLRYDADGETEVAGRAAGKPPGSVSRCRHGRSSISSAGWLSDNETHQTYTIRYMNAKQQLSQDLGDTAVTANSYDRGVLALLSKVARHRSLSATSNYLFMPCCISLTLP